MADNIDVTGGSGNTVAADEISDGTLGSVKVQFVKIMDGDLDSTTKYGGTNAFPVSVGNRPDIGRVHNVVDGTITVASITARPDVQRVHNVVDGTMTVADITAITARPDINRVHNVVDGTITVASITNRPDVQRVHNVVDGTMSVSDVVAFSARPDIQRVHNVVAGTMTVSGTVTANAGTGTLTVALDPGYTLGYIAGTKSTLAVSLDPGYTLGYIAGTKSTLAVSLDPGYTLGYIAGSKSSIAVYFDRGNPATNVTNLSGIGHTMGIYTATGSSAAAGASGITVISPSANYNFKIFAYSIQTTGILASALTFANGSGASQTEFWRPLVAKGGSVASDGTPFGANLAVTPPGYLFATGTNTTLVIAGNNGSTIHYSVAYIKETA